MKKIIKNTIIAFQAFLLLLAFNASLNAQNVNVDNTVINIGTGYFITTDGSMQIQNSGAIDNSGTVKVTGNWTNDASGLINASPGTVELNGTTVQTIGGSAVTTFNNLTINNSNGITLAGNVIVNGTLTFTSGKITTGANYLILGSSASVTGAGAGQYVNGNLRRFIPATANAVVNFDIGDAANYTPVLLNFAGTPSGSSSIDAATSIAAPPVASGISQTQYVNRQWNLNNNGVSGFTSYNATFNFTSGDVIGGANTASFIAANYNAPNWTLPTVGVKTSTSTEITGATAFGTFAIGVAGCNSAPVAPGSIAGPNAVCLNSDASFSIAAVPGATGYTWSAGPGATISLGQGNANVTISFNGFATASNVTVYASNACGNSIVRTKSYVVSSLIPAQPVTINGQQNGLCNLTNVAYNCPAVANATSYLWAVPAGVTILSGQGTNAISVKFTGAFITSGTISVIAQSGCGNSAARTRTVNSKPQQPVISGLNWACKGQAGLLYSVAAVAGATSYTWTPVAGSTIVSGQGTTSIVYNWGNINGVIYCKANNGCGSSLTASKPVSFTCKEDGSLFEISDLNLYPNPASTAATLQFEGIADGKAQLQLFDLVGKEIINEDLNVSYGNNEYQLDLASYPKGVYQVRIVYNGFTRNTKLVVQ